MLTNKALDISPSFDNLSNMNTSSEDRGFNSYYSLAAVVVVLIPLTVVNLVVSVTILRESSMPSILKLILIDNLVSAEVVIVGMLQVFLGNILVPLLDVEPSHFACKLALATISSGGSARFLHMTAFAIAIFCLVKYGARRVQFRTNALVSIVLWLLAIIPNTAMFFETVAKTIFLSDVVCTFYGVRPLIFVYALGCGFFYGVCSIALGIVFLVLTGCYIRKRTFLEGKDFRNGMIKCAAFLCIGNVLSFVGLSIPLIIAIHGEAVATSSILVTVQGLIVILSLIPVPFFMIFYLKSIRRKLVDSFVSCNVKMHSFFVNACKCSQTFSC